MQRYKSIFKEDLKLDRFLNIIRISNNNINIEDVTVEATPKGNWQVYWKGRPLMIVKGNLLDDRTIIKYGLEHHGGA